MRDLVIFLSFMAVIPATFYQPFAGVLVWSWVAFANIHRETYGFAYDLQFNMVAAALTMLMWLLSSKEKLRIPPHTITYLLIGFILITSLSTVFALDPKLSQIYWERNIKTFILAFAVGGLIYNRARINGFIWIVAIALGYWAAKSGLFSIATGGNYRIWGPQSSHIYDNNHLAVAFVMLLPLLFYLRAQTKEKYLRMAIMGVMIFDILAILGTYSRGGLLALSALAAYAVLRMKGRIKLVLLILIMAVPIITFLPSHWFERMDTIQDISEDASVQGRFEAWTYAWRVAQDRPIVGGGYNSSQVTSVFKAYMPESVSEFKAAHSIYFQVMGDHGFIGFILFMALAYLSIRTTRRIAKKTEHHEDLLWAHQLATMLQLSFVGFYIGGAAVSLAYYDVYYCLLMIMVNLDIYVRVKLAKLATDEVADTSTQYSKAGGGSIPSSPAPAYTRAP